MCRIGQARFIMEECNMKIKSVLASVAACAIAVSAMAISAAAEVTNGNATGDDGKKFWTYDVKENADDITKVYGFEVKITPSDTAIPSGIGGGMGMNSNSLGWKSVEWGNPDSGKAVIVDTENWTMKYVNTASFAADDEYAQVWVQNWWGAELTVDSVKLLDKDGNEIGAAPADTTAAATTTTTAAATTTTSAAAGTTTTAAATTTTAAAGAAAGDAGVAVVAATLALAGAAAFVARKKD